MAPEKTPRRLGRGLDALFSSAPPAVEEPRSALKEIPITKIRMNPFQPRKDFAPDALKDLRESLNSSGLLQPITVRPSREEGSFELVAGERRLRAATELGWNAISAVVKDIDDRELLGLALIENLQRSDLNPIEEAEGYSRLIQEFGHTQQTVASMVGRDRSTIANMLRILQLPERVRQMLRDGSLTIGHARPLLGLSDEARITELADEIVKRGLNAREVENRVRQSPIEKTPTVKRGRPTKRDSRPLEIRSFEEHLRRLLQTDVSITADADYKGAIRISFYSLEDLERVADLLEPSNKTTTLQ
ncbi:MAG TPA: ParB/RepB/Spo0J family partition protein [Gemmatimonadaceae bacterium]|nr:ParB/RepB/Spo0J family partition protein [Gemmatimonadaceae bacterium]